MPNEASNQKNFSIGLIAATFFLVGFETLFFIPVIADWRYAFATLSRVKFLIPDDLTLFVLYVIFPIIYCSIASVMFRPKKLVHPINVQVITITIVSLIAINNVSIALAQSQTSFPYETLIYITTSILFSSFIAIAIGFLQWIAVTWVIGMSFDSIDQVSFEVNMHPKVILRKLGSFFLDTYNFSRIRDCGEIWVLKRKENNRVLIIEIGEHPSEKDKSIISAVAYEEQRGWIVKTDHASHIRDRIVEDVEKQVGITFRDKKIEPTDSVSRLAYSNAFNLSRSKIDITWSFFKKLSMLYQAAIIITASLLFGLFLIFTNFNQNNSLTLDTYLGITVALVISLTLEIGVPLREELARKKRDDLELD